MTLYRTFTAWDDSRDCRLSAITGWDGSQDCRFSTFATYGCKGGFPNCWHVYTQNDPGEAPGALGLPAGVHDTVSYIVRRGGGLDPSKILCGIEKGAVDSKCYF